MQQRAFVDCMPRLSKNLRVSAMSSPSRAYETDKKSISKLSASAAMASLSIWDSTCDAAGMTSRLRPTSAQVQGGTTVSAPLQALLNRRLLL